MRIGLSWHPGYGFDIGVYQGWARSAVELGMAESYLTQVGGNMTPDYPPLSIMMLTGFGHVYKLLFHEFDLSSVTFRMYIKLPAMFTDVLICTLLYFLCKRWKNSTRIGLLAALAYALNPAAIYDSAIWGQTDCIYSFFLLAAVAAWSYEKKDLSAVMLACSILTKMQGIVLYPLFALLVLRTSPKELLRFCIVGITTVIVVMLPFAMGNVLESIADVYFGAVGRYGNVTVGAYNFWWSLLADRGWQIESSVSPFGYLRYSHIGFLVFGLVYALILWIFHKALVRSEKTDALFYCSALVTAAFFLFLPQMHERYLFPFVVLGTPLIFMGRNIAIAYWIMVIAFTMNLMGVSPLTFIDKALYREFDSLDVFVATTQVWMFIYLVITAYVRYAPRAAWNAGRRALLSSR